MSDNKKPRVAVYCRVGRKEQLVGKVPASEGNKVEFTGDSMYELLSMHKGYDDITRAAMELVLEEGPDALMYQLNYDDVDFLREEFPVIYKRAIELGILTEDE